jgi:alpha-glucosidase
MTKQTEAPPLQCFLDARHINIPLNFLSDGNCIAAIYTDANDVNENPNHLNMETRIVTNKNVISINIAGGGGEVMWLKKQ